MLRELIGSDDSYQDLVVSLQPPDGTGNSGSPVYDRIATLDRLIRRVRRRLENEQGATPANSDARVKLSIRYQTYLAALRTRRAEEVREWLDGELARSALLSELATQIANAALSGRSEAAPGSEPDATDLQAMILTARSLPRVTPKTYRRLKEQLVREGRPLFVHDEDSFNRDSSGASRIINLGNARARLAAALEEPAYLEQYAPPAGAVMAALAGVRMGAPLEEEPDLEMLGIEAAIAARAYGLSRRDFVSNDRLHAAESLEILRSHLSYLHQRLRRPGAQLCEALAQAIERSGGDVLGTSIRVKPLGSTVDKLCSEEFLTNAEFLEAETGRERGVADANDLVGATIYVEDPRSLAIAEHTVEQLLRPFRILAEKQNKFFDEKAASRFYEALHYTVRLGDLSFELQIKTRAAAKASAAERNLLYKVGRRSKIPAGSPAALLVPRSPRKPLSVKNKNLLHAMLRALLYRDLKRYSEEAPPTFPPEPPIGLEDLGWSAFQLPEMAGISV